MVRMSDRSSSITREKRINKRACIGSNATRSANAAESKRIAARSALGDVSKKEQPQAPRPMSTNLMMMKVLFRSFIRLNSTCNAFKF